MNKSEKKKPPRRPSHWWMGEMCAHFYEFLPPRAPLGSHSKYQKKKKKKNYPHASSSKRNKDLT